jgi:hypothetical protein
MGQSEHEPRTLTNANPFLADLSQPPEQNPLPSDERDMRRQQWEWQLRKDQTLFYFALGVLGAAVGVACIALLTGEYQSEFIVGAGLFLANIVMALLRHLTGVTPPLITLSLELIKAWSSRNKTGPSR